MVRSEEHQEEVLEFDVFVAVKWSFLLFLGFKLYKSKNHIIDYQIMKSSKRFLNTKSVKIKCGKDGKSKGKNTLIESFQIEGK